MRIRVILTLLAFVHDAAAAAPENPGARPEHAAWVQAMKSDPKGPFSRIRWFCRDGAVLPPRPYGCREHGGGSQHGQWSEQTAELRAAGYRIANFYSDLDIDAVLESRWGHEDLAQMAIEQFLIRADDGWILRQARFYRGAFQEEGERAGARRLLLKMAENKEWLTTRYLQWRATAALLAHGVETPSLQGVRQMASTLSERDPGFLKMRNKIHSLPTPADADLVEDYASRVADGDLKREMGRLAGAIRDLHDISAQAVLEELSARLESRTPPSAARVAELQQALAAAETRADRFAASAVLLAELRRMQAIPNDPGSRLQILDASIRLESEHFAAASDLHPQLVRLTRRERLALLGHALESLYGTGLISGRQLDALRQTLDGILTGDPGLSEYRAALAHLSLGPGWGTQSLRFAFERSMRKLAEIEPLAVLFIQDQLRGSPMSMYAEVVDGLVRDANRLAGAGAVLFGEEVGAKARALNPGLAKGILRDGRGLKAGEFQRDGIYLLPETEADLPPIAGIITAGEGNPLSHVQLLARNLGIPNLAVDDVQLERLRSFTGDAVIMAVSVGGAVNLAADRGQLDHVLGKREPRGTELIEPDLEKLDLAHREFIDLSRLGAEDSGRVVGPKAAKLGELKRHFPEAVGEGIAVPFGMFRALLDQPAPEGQGTMFRWIADSYRQLERLAPGSHEQAVQTERLRELMENWISTADPGDAFRTALRRRLKDRFGPDGTFGVFVRSDTNVEDLPGFTGAGLNLTLPNVVGIENIARAISKVWASPFSPRAFAWRQAFMSAPEHVYPAVLLLGSADVDKSGVMVTRDVDTGEPGRLSVAVNEGVGGAVDGQSAESLRIPIPEGRVRLMAQATAPVRRRIDPAGGVLDLPASGDDYVLAPAEIRRLRELAMDLPDRFPPIVDAAGRAAPADIEFGFQDGELRLFQIRPFLDSTAARSNEYLRTMDPDPARLAAIIVDLDRVPE